MNTVTKLLAATALLASASTATLAQVNVGGALDAGGSVSTDAGSTSVDAGANGNANANANANSNADGNGSAGGNSNAGGNSVETNAGGNAAGSVNNNAGGNANASANASGGAQGNLNYGSIISDLRTSSATTADVQAFVEGDTEVNIVTLSELRGNAAENASALDQAVNAQTAALADLRVAIAANAVIMAELDAAGYTADQVVAVTTSAEGDVTLVVDASAS
jgi:hypothetical protein